MLAPGSIFTSKEDIRVLISREGYLIYSLGIHRVRNKLLNSEMNYFSIVVESMVDIHGFRTVFKISKR